MTELTITIFTSGIQRIIGKPAFQAGLQKYFKTYKMQSADFNDFMNCFGNMSKGLTVKKFSEQWLNQPGLLYSDLPLVNILKMLSIIQSYLPSHRLREELL